MLHLGDGWWPYFGWLSRTCACWGLLYDIYLAYQRWFVIQLCINNWFLEIAHVFQSIWTQKKIEKYDSKKLQGSEGSNPNRMHGSGSVQVRKFCRRFRFRFRQKGVWIGLNQTSATLFPACSRPGSVVKQWVASTCDVCIYCAHDHALEYRLPIPTVSHRCEVLVVDWKGERGWGYSCACLNMEVIGAVVGGGWGIGIGMGTGEKVGIWSYMLKYSPKFKWDSIWLLTVYLI